MKRNQDFLKLVVDREATENRVTGVYLVTDHGNRLTERVREAVAGGISVLQYRDKERDAAAKAAMGRELRDICKSAGVTFIINDDVQLAKELDADGVHLGQEDGDPAEARRILGPKKLIGVSTHNLEEAQRAE